MPWNLLRPETCSELESSPASMQATWGQVGRISRWRKQQNWQVLNTGLYFSLDWYSAYDRNHNNLQAAHLCIRYFNSYCIGCFEQNIPGTEAIKSFYSLFLNCRNYVRVEKFQGCGSPWMGILAWTWKEGTKWRGEPLMTNQTFPRTFSKKSPALPHFLRSLIWNVAALRWAGTLLVFVPLQFQE